MKDVHWLECHAVNSGVRRLTYCVVCPWVAYMPYGKSAGKGLFVQCERYTFSLWVKGRSWTREAYAEFCPVTYIHSFVVNFTAEEASIIFQLTLTTHCILSPAVFALSTTRVARTLVYEV